MDQQKKNDLKRWSTMVLLCLAGSLIYRLPYLREVYYVPLQSATGASNGELGMLMSAYGFVSFLLYFPGGWAADRFSARKLISFSCVSTGLLGLYFAVLPSFKMILFIHGIWAITTVFTFWPAAIRAICFLGPSEEQGKLFGLWYFGKGVTSTVFGLLSIFIFTKLSEGILGLRGIILFYAVVLILVGVLAWFLIEEKRSSQEEKKLEFKDILKVIKMPQVWLAGVMVFATWSIFIGFGFVTPFLTTVFNMKLSQAALVNSLRAYVMYSAGGLCGTFLADRCGSRIKFMRICFVGMAIFAGVYLFIPSEETMIYLVIANMVMLGVFVYSAVSVFFSVIDEVNVPKELVGTAAGLISLVGYFPDTFLYSVLGHVIDKNPGIVGYHYVFLFMVLAALVGLGCGFILLKIKARKDVKIDTDMNTLPAQNN